MLFFLTLACLLVSSTVASPVGLGNKDGGMESDDASPDLLSVIGSFKGKNPIETLSNFMKEYKIFINSINKLMTMSPFIKNMLEETAKTDVEARLVLKLAKGEVPDVHDLYDLLKHKKEGIASGLSASYRKSSRYHTIINVLHKTSVDSSQDVQAFFHAYSGADVTIDPHVVADIRKKTFKATPTNFAESNLVVLMSFLQVNFRKFVSITSAVLDGSTSYTGLLKGILSLDYSSLSHVKALQPQIDNNKYSVSSPQSLVADPDAAVIQQDLQKAQQLTATSEDQSKAEMLVSDIFNRFVNMFYRVTETLKASRGQSSTSNKGSPSLG